MQLDADICYQAMCSRDARFDGKFFTGVVTTGIYCRPVCPARTPKRPNVKFYACAAAAEDAGFRPCRRCRPETAPWTPAWQGTSATVGRALRLLDEGAIDNDNLVKVADRLGISERHLRRLFANHLGASPIAVARTHRIHLARRLIDETSMPMSQLAFAAGFASIRSFNDAIRTGFGASPTELRGKSTRAHQNPSSLVVRLAYRPPLAWRELLRFFALRAIAGVEQVTDRSYRRTIDVGGKAGAIEVSPIEGRHQLELTVEGIDPKHIGGAIERARRLFDLNADPLPISQQFQADPILRRVWKRSPGLRVPGCWDPFEVAVRAIIGQQVSVAAARTILGRIAQRFGTRVSDTEVLFPTASQLVEAELPGVGLTRARAATVRRLARAVSDGQIDLDHAAVEPLIASLCELPGIGPWTAQYVAMRGLGEPDVFLPTDLGVRRALAVDGQLPSPQQVEERADAWRPWRAYAVIGLWSTHC